MKSNVVVPKRMLETGLVVDEPAKQSSKLDNPPLRLLRCREVERRTGLSRSSIWRLEHRGAFPKRIQVSANIVAWLEDDVISWIESRVGQVAV